MGLLPTKKSEIGSQDPKNLILFGLPKVGKTTALAELPNNLVIDLENGTDFVSGYVVKANNYIDLYKIAKELKETEHNFKFVTLDTVTALEDIALDLAAKRYQESPVGKNWQGTGKDILKLPSGSGYYWARTAMQEIIGWFEQENYNLILTGHVRDENLTEGGTELNVKQLDLQGKTANILSAKSDAICYVYRDVETGHLYCNFGDMNSVLCGARMGHLAGRTILLAERVQQDNGNWQIKTYWENIFPSLK
jgi:hypothetical protein